MPVMALYGVCERSSRPLGVVPPEGAIQALRAALSESAPGPPPYPGGKVTPPPSRSDLRDLVTFAGQGAKEDHNEDHNQDHAGEDHNEGHNLEIAVTSEDHKITKVTREGSGDDLESVILASLSPEFPQSLGKIMRTVKENTGDGSNTGAELDRLVAEGRVTDRGGRYTLA